MVGNIHYQGTNDVFILSWYSNKLKCQCNMRKILNSLFQPASYITGCCINAVIYHGKVSVGEIISVCSRRVRIVSVIEFACILMTDYWPLQSGQCSPKGPNWYKLCDCSSAIVSAMVEQFCGKSLWVGLQVFQEHSNISIVGWSGSIWHFANSHNPNPRYSYRYKGAEILSFCGGKLASSPASSFKQPTHRMQTAQDNRAFHVPVCVHFCWHC